MVHHHEFLSIIWSTSESCVPVNLYWRQTMSACNSTQPSLAYSDINLLDHYETGGFYDEQLEADGAPRSADLRYDQWCQVPWAGWRPRFDRNRQTGGHRDLSKWRRPIQDIRDSEKIQTVMANGQIFEADRMNRFGDSAPRAPFYWDGSESGVSIGYTHADNVGCSCLTGRH